MPRPAPGSRPACPKCGGPLERIARRWIDRLTSLVAPSRRYRCRSMHCKWEGKLRNADLDLHASDAEKRYDRRIE